MINYYLGSHEILANPKLYISKQFKKINFFSKLNQGINHLFKIISIKNIKLNFICDFSDASNKVEVFYDF